MALLVAAGPAAAQLSPGDLNQVHDHLDGMRKCKSCHDLGNREVQDRCLACHREIDAMRSGGRGLHARPEFARCVDCHVEHQGRGYELIQWPQGRDDFDHASVGFPLSGRHAAQDCRACHTTRYVTDPGRLKGAGKNLERTYLGLDRACQACHKDPHAGQFQKDCTACHDASTWKPAPLFDHATTTYPLTGRHAQVACASCHKPVEPPRAVVFAALPHTSCTDCHRDPHAGSLGSRCTDCHATGGWKQIQGAGFDHDRTRYPLRGRHATTTCTGCHQEKGGTPKFARCDDCHRDEHGGKTRNRPGWRACDRCHTVDGYRPARFGLADHDTTAFPLTGAHRATPCGPCHQPAAPQSAGARQTRIDLAPPATACTACHADPHRWTAAAPPACTTCHVDETWRTVAFDHGATRFALTGRHQTVACGSCHRPPGDAASSAPRFGGEPSACVGCHRDVHEGTMTRTAAETAGIDCSRCHVTADWLAENFDHDRDSRFALQGAHARVACRACHREPAGGPLVVFRPLAAECVACHAVVPAAGKENP